MACNSYRDILTNAYYTIPDFHDYVDRWCKANKKAKHHAFEDPEVQRECAMMLLAESK